MTRRTVTSVLFLAALAGLMVPGGRADAATWSTCTPRQIDYITEAAPNGVPVGYRVGADLFAGKRGTLCISSERARFGTWLTVDSSVPAQRGGVAAAPYIRTGPWYGAGDSASVFPMPASSMSPVTDHVGVFGDGRGVWEADTDTFGYRSDQAVSGNPDAELVIATRWRGIREGGRLVHLSGHWWYAQTWITSGGAQGPHPLILFALVHQDDRVSEYLPAFRRWAQRQGWWPRDARVVGNTALQLEIWSNGKGMRLGLSVTDPLPVIHPLT
jgi:hypothetical protein